MRTGFWNVLGAVGLVAVFAPSAQAATFTVDQLIGAIDSGNSGQGTETAALEAACSCDITLLNNVNNPTTGFDDAGSRYIDVGASTPGYFLLKFGTGNSGNDMFFFKNVGELSKLVWTDALLVANGLPSNHVQSISHYAITTNTATGATGATGNTATGATGATGNNVPEPVALSLLGLGLAALAYRQKRA